MYRIVLTLILTFSLALPAKSSDIFGPDVEALINKTQETMKDFPGLTDDQLYADFAQVAAQVIGIREKLMSAVFMCMGLSADTYVKEREVFLQQEFSFEKQSRLNIKWHQTSDEGQVKLSQLLAEHKVDRYDLLDAYKTLINIGIFNSYLLANIQLSEAAADLPNINIFLLTEKNSTAIEDEAVRIIGKQIMGVVSTQFPHFGDWLISKAPSIHVNNNPLHHNLTDISAEIEKFSDIDLSSQCYLAQKSAMHYFLYLKCVVQLATSLNPEFKKQLEDSGFLSKLFKAKPTTVSDDRSSAVVMSQHWLNECDLFFDSFFQLAPEQVHKALLNFIFLKGDVTINYYTKVLNSRGLKDIPPELRQRTIFLRCNDTDAKQKELPSNEFISEAMFIAFLLENNATPHDLLVHFGFEIHTVLLTNFLESAFDSGYVSQNACMMGPLSLEKIMKAIELTDEMVDIVEGRLTDLVAAAAKRSSASYAKWLDAIPEGGVKERFKVSTQVGFARFAVVNKGQDTQESTFAMRCMLENRLLCMSLIRDSCPDLKDRISSALDVLYDYLNTGSDDFSNKVKKVVLKAFDKLEKEDKPQAVIIEYKKPTPHSSARAQKLKDKLRAKLPKTPTAQPEQEAIPEVKAKEEPPVAVAKSAEPAVYIEAPALPDDVESLKKMVTAKAEIINKAIPKLKEAQASLEQEKTKTEAQSKKVEELATELEALQKVLAALKTTLQSKDAQIQKSAATHKTYKKEMDAKFKKQAADYEKLKAEHEKQQASFQVIKSELKKAQEQSAKFSEALTGLNRQIGQMRNEQAQAIESHMAINRKLKTDLAANQKQMEDIRHENQELRNEQAASQYKLGLLMKAAQSRDKLDEDLLSLQISLDYTLAELADEKKKTANLEAENERLEDTMQSMYVNKFIIQNEPIAEAVAEAISESEAKKQSLTTEVQILKAKIQAVVSALTDTPTIMPQIAVQPASLPNTAPEESTYDVRTDSDVLYSFTKEQLQKLAYTTVKGGCLEDESTYKLLFGDKP
jgi:hypothetical protein